ncbi:hypothetical protein LJR289_004086 [Pseudoduganella sp. LjRoot289]|uniref:hypothetical protein n=1 Tax=Pseudoduganella sp. LjRoot289 TaxID=3342314 RepID=UPI003ECEAF8B
MKQPAQASLLCVLMMGAMLGNSAARAGEPDAAAPAPALVVSANGNAGTSASWAAAPATAAQAGAGPGIEPALQPAQAAPDARLASLDGILSALYATISGAAGEARDWERLRSLFTHEGRMVVHGPNKAGDITTRVLSVSDYISRVTPLFAREGFYESELTRTTETFGQIAHVFSTYEARHAADDAKPFLRGVNSIQLVNDGQRWWILSLVWQAESEQAPLPERYLKGKH